MATEITSLSQFNTLKAKALLIVDFYAHWCGPCKQISPVFERLAAQSKSSLIVFAKVDVDACKDVAQQCGITAMPTFQFYKKNVKVDEIRGADVQGLTTKIKYYCAGIQTSAPGNKLGQSSDAGIRSLIDLDRSRLINATSRSNIKGLLRPSFAGAAAVDSADGQSLLVHLPFSVPVSITSIKLSVPANATSQAPSKIHVGTNVDAAKDLLALVKAENVQSFSLYSDDYVNASTTLQLKPGKFKGITSLTILIDANISTTGATQISQIDLVGTKA